MSDTTFSPSLSTLITLDDIPVDLGFFETITEEVLGEIFYKNLTVTLATWRYIKTKNILSK